MKDLASQLTDNGSTSPLVYVAGPFAGAVPANVAAAVVLGRLLEDLGRVPYVPHAQGLLMGFGRADLAQWHDGEMYVARIEADGPERREQGLRFSSGLLEMVAALGGSMVAILEDDATTKSSGTLSEISMWKNRSQASIAWVLRSALRGVCEHCGGAGKVLCHPRRLQVLGGTKCLACEHGIGGVFVPCPVCGEVTTIAARVVVR